MARMTKVMGKHSGRYSKEMRDQDNTYIICVSCEDGQDGGRIWARGKERLKSGRLKSDLEKKEVKGMTMECNEPQRILLGVLFHLSCLVLYTWKSK